MVWHDRHRAASSTPPLNAPPPHNRHATPTAHPEFQAREGVLHLTTQQVLSMTQEQFSATFRHSPIKRAKLAGLRRNAQALTTPKQS